MGLSLEVSRWLPQESIRYPEYRCSCTAKKKCKACTRNSFTGSSEISRHSPYREFGGEPVRIMRKPAKPTPAERRAKALEATARWMKENRNRVPFTKDLQNVSDEYADMKLAVVQRAFGSMFRFYAACVEAKLYSKAKIEHAMAAKARAISRVRKTVGALSRTRKPSKLS